MGVEAKFPLITSEIAGSRPGNPLRTPPDVMRARFSVVPLGGLPLPGSESIIPTINTELIRKEDKQKPESLYRKVGKESHRPRNRKGYHDKNGRWVLRRRGTRGYRCKMTNHEKNPCPTPERCQNPKAAPPISGERSNRSATMARNINTAPSARRQNRNREQPKTQAA